MSKQPKTTTPTDADLAGNPGIGASRGVSAVPGGDLDDIEGDSTFEGDVDNEVGEGGGVDPQHRGRTNR